MQNQYLITRRFHVIYVSSWKTHFNPRRETLWNLNLSACDKFSGDLMLSHPRACGSRVQKLLCQPVIALWNEWILWVVPEGMGGSPGCSIINFSYYSEYNWLVCIQSEESVVLWDPQMKQYIEYRHFHFVLVCFVTNVEVNGDSFTSNFEIVTLYKKIS